MRGVAAKLADHAQQNGPWLRAARGKLDLALADVGLDIVQPLQEIIVPGGAAVFAIGDGPKPERLLFADHALNLAILDFGECVHADLAALALVSRFLQRRRAQQAADMVGSEWRFGTGPAQPHTSSAISTIIRSFAHCSSSASTLPSSVEAKPHCGARQ